MITRAAPEYGIRLSDIKEQSYSFKASGIANNLFLWWKNWFKICESKPKEDLTDFSQFKEFFFLDEDEDLEATTKPSDMETLLSTVDPDAEDEYKPISPNRIIYVYGDWADEEHEDDEVPESLKRAKEWAIKHDLVFNIIPLSENMKDGAQWPGFDILGPYKTIFVWYKKFYANEGEENEKGFRDYLFYDEYDTPQEETDSAYKEELAEQKKMRS